MINHGWISLHRKVQEHWIFKDKREFSKFEAWIDILLNVNHSNQKVNIKNAIISVERGESIRSLDTWAKRWNWNKSKTRRFLKLLESDTMVVLKPTHQTTHLKVLNYDSYQDLRNTDETQMKRKRNASESQLTPNNKDNKDNNKRSEVNFKNSLSPFLDIYGKDMLNEFFWYWTEKNDNGKKMRFEYSKNQPFNIDRRLTTWSNRQSNFINPKKQDRL